ncbi:MAG TPA: acyltransferase [Candidatus Cloacimonas sp.]|nr:acyltransferase [Candidatus Cloacimonas sp.]
MSFLYSILSKIHNQIIHYENKQKEKIYRREFNIHPTARLNYIDSTWLKGNITIGANTYINSGRLISGNQSLISSGKWCAIGHNVNIIAWTHDIENSTGPQTERPCPQKSIIIGNNVWIGSNVFIREGVKIGNESIVGANSVVTKNVDDYAIVGGVPAKVIKYKRKKDGVL